MGQLYELNLVRIISRCGNQCRIICIVGKQLRHLLQYLLHLLGLLNDEFFHLRHFPILFLHQMIHIKAVSLVGRNASG